MISVNSYVAICLCKQAACSRSQSSHAPQSLSNVVKYWNVFHFFLTSPLFNCDCDWRTTVTDKIDLCDSLERKEKLCKSIWMPIASVFISISVDSFNDHAHVDHFSKASNDDDYFWIKVPHIFFKKNHSTLSYIIFCCNIIIITAIDVISIWFFPFCFFSLHYYVFFTLLRLRQQHKNILNAKANAKVGFISVVQSRLIHLIVFSILL